MTDSEAIKFLKLGKEEIDNEIFDEAIDIAIEALKQRQTHVLISDKNISINPEQIEILKEISKQGYLSSTFNLPECCRNCSNNPANGGSGICNCALPYMTQTNTIRNFMTGTQSTGVDEYQITLDTETNNGNTKIY